MVCATGRASEWVSAAYSKDGTLEVFVDVSSMRIDGSIRRVWEKFVASRHAMKGFGENRQKFVSYELSRVGFNCSEQTGISEATIIYYEDGTTETLQPEVLRKTWEPIPPDSVQSFEMEFVCNWKVK